MKKLMFFVTIMLVALLGSQMVHAESYQRWIYFINKPKHVMTAGEMADITGALGKGEISPQITYRLSTGVTYRIPQPNLFFQYIMMCVKEGEPSIITTDDVVREIQGGDVVQWGNDISVRVKNYYFSSLHNRIQFIDNYSGVGVDSVFILLINGKPKIKMDCGNPLGQYVYYNNDHKLLSPSPQNPKIPTLSPKSPKKGSQKKRPQPTVNGHERRMMSQGSRMIVILERSYYRVPPYSFRGHVYRSRFTRPIY